MDDLVGGIKRVTLPLPTRPGHVHAYLLPGSEGWIVVDTGVGLPEAKEVWSAALDRAGGRVAAVFVTHFHPDHVGAAADLHELTGAPVYQGALDYAQCELVWGNPAWSERLVEWFRLHGAPDDVTEELVGQSSLYRPFIRYQRDPILVEAGRAPRRLGARRRLGPCGRPALPPQGRRPRRCGSRARKDHADGRALAGESRRPARRLPRGARADGRARAGRRPSRSRGRRRGARRHVPGSSRSTIACGSRRRSPRSATSRGRATSCRIPCSAPT